MQGNIALSIVLGIGLAGANIALSTVYLRKAMRAPSAQFVGAVFKGMGLRMVGLLGTLILVFLLVPVHAMAFALSFLTVTIVGLAVEVRMLLRTSRPSRDSGPNGIPPQVFE